MALFLPMWEMTCFSFSLLYTSAHLATFFMTFALLVGPDWYVAYMMISAIWT